VNTSLLGYPLLRVFPDHRLSAGSIIAKTTAKCAVGERGLREKLDAYIDEHRDRLIAEAQRILRFPSVKGDADGPGAPFGRPIADALKSTLELCADLGMATENFEGYAGHAEFGTGAEIVAMLGHLDVVPAGKDWTRDPWGGVVADGRLWGRGASDDKGPTYAALFGAKAVLDVSRAAGVTLNRRVRLIFGCDEESGWECMEHYFGAAGQQMPTVAFTPDADFPLVHAEKGSFTGVARRVISPVASASLHVVAVESGLRPNMVPDEAVARIAGDADALGPAEQVLGQTPGVAVANEGEFLVVHARGRGAHGSTPEEGDNAAVKLLRALTGSSSAFDDISAEDEAWMVDLARRGDPAGAGNDIACSDEITGALTSNLGIVTLRGGIVEATFNVRYPATLDGETLIARFRDSLATTGWDVPNVSHTPPLYVPLDQEPVRTLLRVYREQTGDMSAPKTMGGRTYATAVAPVGVAFGPSRAGDPDVAHRADECIAIDRLIECAKIYAHALYELAK
jgi:succinyl-diaminopimelate desuccinylase